MKRNLVLIVLYLCFLGCVVLKATPDDGYTHLEDWDDKASFEDSIKFFGSYRPFIFLLRPSQGNEADTDIYQEAEKALVKKWKRSIEALSKKENRPRAEAFIRMMKEAKQGASAGQIMVEIWLIRYAPRLSAEDLPKSEKKVVEFVKQTNKAVKELDEIDNGFAKFLSALLVGNSIFGISTMLYLVELMEADPKLKSVVMKDADPKNLQEFEKGVEMLDNHFLK